MGSKVNIEKVLKILAYAIPLGLFLWVVYLNILPFGYSKDFTINVLEDGTVVSSSPSEVYLEDLDGEKIDSLDSFYGVVNLVIKPKAVLKNASLNVSLVGNDVYLGVEPEIKNWDYVFDFSSGIPDSLVGNATYDPSRKCVYFDGTSRLELPNSYDDFENGSFAVYAEWIPESNASFQEIVGHYNWELLQYGDKVRFMVGRMNSEGQTFSNLIGEFYGVDQFVDKDFLNSKHNALAIYNSKYFISLFLDHELTDVVNLNNKTIWSDYNENRSISLGLSNHGDANPFYGCMVKISLSQNFNYAPYKKSHIAGMTIWPLFGSGDLEAINIELIK